MAGASFLFLLLTHYSQSPKVGYSHLSNKKEREREPGQNQCTLNRSFIFHSSTACHWSHQWPRDNLHFDTHTHSHVHNVPPRGQSTSAPDTWQLEGIYFPLTQIDCTLSSPRSGADTATAFAWNPVVWSGHITQFLFLQFGWCNVHVTFASSKTPGSTGRAICSKFISHQAMCLFLKWCHTLRDCHSPLALHQGNTWPPLSEEPDVWRA